MRTAYKCRAYPDPEQAVVISRTFGCVRLVWNKTLAERRRRYQVEGKRTSYKETDAALTAWKKTEDLAFLNEVSSVPLQQTLRHQHIRNARADFLHRTSTDLIRAADTIVIEDLAVTNMVKNRRLARAIHDAAWGEFRRQSEYKCQRAGRHLVVIDRWYPSSKTCSACGHLVAELPLSTRHWTCPQCRTRHDRDHNAAKNILAAGRAVSACGADISHSGSPRVQSATKQKSSRSDPGRARGGRL